MFRYPLLCAGVLSVALLATACGGTQVPEGSPPPIAWHEWGEAFEHARVEGRLVILDLGTEGCSACRPMHETTYADANVRRRVADHFVAVTVDASTRPDLADRYGHWGRPTTVFLSADGDEVLAIGGNRHPEEFLPILDELIGRNRRGRLAAEVPMELDAVIDPRPVEGVCTTANGQLNELVDLSNAGVEHALFRARTWDDDDALTRVLETLDGYRRNMDPGLGIVFAEGFDAEGGSLVAEKQTTYLARALLGFARAYAVTGDAGWREAALELDRYLTEWLRAPDGTFYASHRVDATGPNNDADTVDHVPNPEGRARFETLLDTVVYTDDTAAVIRAYTALYVATDDLRHADRAREAAAVLVEDRMTPDGWVLQSANAWWVDGSSRLRAHRPENRPFLSAQAGLALALLDLHVATGEVRWLRAAETIVESARAHLWDDTRRVFLATTPLAGDPTPPTVPVAGNAEMARALLRLASLHADVEMRGLAVDVVEGLAGRHVDGESASVIALAAEEVSTGLVVFTVVGDSESTDARALFDASTDAADARGLVHFDDAGRYPSMATPAVFVCNDQTCSPPISNPERLVEVAGEFAASVSDCWQ